MKLHRALTPLLILTLAACAGPKLPWQQEDPGIEPIHAAYDKLMSDYVDQPSVSVLLQGAYQGAREALASAGVNDAELQAPDWTQGRNQNWDRFEGAYDQMTTRHAKQVGSDKLEYAAIRGMADSLKDCQTKFLDPQTVKERQAAANGQQDFGGIGVIMKNIPGHPTVQRVLDGPAKSAGLQPGDEIVAVDGTPTSGQSFDQVRDRIRGPQGSSVSVSVKRPGSENPRSFTISRAQIQAPIFDAGLAANGTIGYLHIYSFPQTMPQQIDQALQFFEDRQVQGIVLDLRANTGGNQQPVLASLSRFVKGGTAEVEIDRSGNRQPLTIDEGQFWKNPKPLVVMADEDTQAGGEMFVKAMQEEGGYKIIGAPTAGCAASAQIYNLSDGSALQVSVRKVTSGRGQEINRVGVKPDQQVPFPVTDLATGRDPQVGAAVEALQAGGGASGSPAASSGQTGSNPQPSPSGAPEVPVLKPVVPQAGPGQVLK